MSAFTTWEKLLQELKATRAMLAKERLDDAEARETLAEIKRQDDYRNRDALMRVRETGSRVAAIGEQLRETTLALFRETGDKTPTEGISIRMNRKLDYDPDEARRWLLETGRWYLLTVNTAAFEKAARGLEQAGELPSFVRFVNAPTPTIASDLTAFLGSDQA